MLKNQTAYLLVVILFSSSSHAQSATAELEVPAQPLLAQVHRLTETIDLVGQPFGKSLIEAINSAKSLGSDDETVAALQRILDPRCLVEIDLSKSGAPKVTRGKTSAELIQQGWRTFLVKVINRHGNTGQLMVDSPNAKSIPHGPADQVQSRWMQISSVDTKPMRKRLSGLALEYRIVQVYCRDVGAVTGELNFAIGESEKKQIPSGDWGKLSVDFDSLPSTLVTLRVADVDGSPAYARFEIRDKLGRIYPVQSKRVAPDFFFQRHIYRGDGEKIALPPGEYTVRCSRGPESITETKQLTITKKPTELVYQVNRWIDPSKEGWWSGDHHIHAAGCSHYENPTQGVKPQDMIRHIMGEDLKVGCNLTWGPCFDYQKRFFTGEVAEQSRYPYTLRYDVEVSGFGSHHSGHLNLLNLKEQIYPGGESKDHWPTLGLNTLRWAKRQGGVCGPAHSGLGLGRIIGRLPNTDGKDGPHALPNFNIPAYDGIGANEFVVDVTHNVPGPDGEPVPAVDFISSMDTDRVAEWNMWYHALNCGFRTVTSGETDFPCISDDRVGQGRVYAHVDGRLSFDKWIQAIADGRSYVSDGKCHLMWFDAMASESNSQIRMGVDGSQLDLEKPQDVVFTLNAAALIDGKEEVDVEWIVNGYVVSTQRIKADGRKNGMRLTHKFDTSSWVAVRVFPHAHTNPIFVVVNSNPVRGTVDSARWCLAGVEQCWKTKRGTYAETEQADAKAAYDHARKVYQQLIEQGG